MSRSLLLALVLGMAVTAGAQQVFVEAGSVSTVFDYRDSEGRGIDNTYSKSQLCYLAGFRMAVYKQIHLTGAVLFNRYSVIGSDPVYDNSYAWDVNYLGLGIGVEGDVWRKRRFALMLRGAAEPQFLISGTQQISQQVYDLRGVEEFERPFLFMRGGIGVNYCLDSKVAVTMRYSYGRGVPIGSTESEERLNLNTQTISIGLLVSLGTCEYCFSNNFRKRKFKR